MEKQKNEEINIDEVALLSPTFCTLIGITEAERTAREAIWRRRLREEEEKEERGRATRGGTTDAVEDSTGPAGSRRLPDDSVEVIMGDSGLSWVASSRGGGAVSFQRKPDAVCPSRVCAAGCACDG